MLTHYAEWKLCTEEIGEQISCFFVDGVLKMCTKQVLNVIARILGPVIAIIDENSITPTEFRCQRFTFCN